MPFHVSSKHQVNDGGTQPLVVHKGEVAEEVATLARGQQDPKCGCAVVILLQACTMKAFVSVKSWHWPMTGACQRSACGDCTVAKEHEMGEGAGCGLVHLCGMLQQASG